AASLTCARQLWIALSRMGDPTQQLPQAPDVAAPRLAARRRWRLRARAREAAKLAAERGDGAGAGLAIKDKKTNNAKPEKATTAEPRPNDVAARQRAPRQRWRARQRVREAARLPAARDDATGGDIAA